MACLNDVSDHKQGLSSDKTKQLISQIKGEQNLNTKNKLKIH